jgi:transcription elongation factor SPT5
MINPNEFGVVVMVGTEQLSIVNHLGVTKNLRPIELRGKANMQSMRASSLDSLMGAMRVGDTVTVIEGPFAQKVGTIKHIHKSTVWLHSDNYYKDAGIFPVRGRSCALAGSVNKNNGDNGSMRAPVGGPGRGGGGRGGRGNARNDMIGKSVTITKGGFKGHLAVIREVYDEEKTYRCELATKMKSVKIPFSDVVAVGDKYGSTQNQNENRAEGSHVMGTPFFQSQTPVHHGSSTPLHLGNETPLGDATPRGDGTPNPYGGDWRFSRGTPNASSPFPTSRSPYPINGSVSVALTDWSKDMLVVLTNAPYTGQKGVLQDRIAAVS